MESNDYWAVDCQPGDPDLFVCMSCIDEVFHARVPVEGCPGCGAIGAFEPFTVEAIRDWGTEGLIQKAERLSPPSVLPNPDSDLPVG